MLKREKKHTKRDGREGRIEIREILSATTSTLTKYPTTKQPGKYDISKQHRKQAKTWEVEGNDKIFANAVFINQGMGWGFDCPYWPWGRAFD